MPTNDYVKYAISHWILRTVSIPNSISTWFVEPNHTIPFTFNKNLSFCQSMIMLRMAGGCHRSSQTAAHAYHRCQQLSSSLLVGSKPNSFHSSCFKLIINIQSEVSIYWNYIRIESMRRNTTDMRKPTQAKEMESSNWCSSITITLSSRIALCILSCCLFMPRHWPTSIRIELGCFWCVIITAIKNIIYINHTEHWRIKRKNKKERNGQCDTILHISMLASSPSKPLDDG